MSNFQATPLPISVQNVAELITTRTKDGGIIQTAGYEDPGDGGGNQYFYRATGRSLLASIRGGFHIAGTGVDDYYEACDKTVINARKHGAVGGRLVDATDIFFNISADCVDFAIAELDGTVQTAKIYVPHGDYRFRYWALPAPATISGEGFEGTFLIAAPNAGTCDFTALASTNQFTTNNFPWLNYRRVRFVSGDTSDNLRTAPEDIDTWSFQTRVTVSADAAEGPNGLTVMDKIIPTVDNSDHNIKHQPFSVTPGIVHTLSVFFKAAGNTWVTLYEQISIQGQCFDIENGVVGSTFAGAPVNAGIEAVPGYPDIFRCWIEFTSGATADPVIYIASADGVYSFAGNGTDGVLAWGAMVSEGTLGAYSGLALPGGIVADKTYFVVNTTVTQYGYEDEVSFQVSEFPGGEPIDLTSDGYGLAVHGSFITDRGNAAKLTPENLNLWSNIKSMVDGSQLTEGDPDFESQYVSAAWDLGQTPNKGLVGGDSIPWGTTASFRNINTWYFSNAVGYEINQNISFMFRIGCEKAGQSMRIRGNGFGMIDADLTGNRGISFQHNRSHPIEVDYAVSPSEIWCDEPVPGIGYPIYFLGDDLPAGLVAQDPYYVLTEDLLTEPDSFDTVADTVEHVGHGLLNGYRLCWMGLNLPGGLSRQTTYFVVNKTDDNFQVSLTKGGAAVDITSVGSGTIQYYKNSMQVSLTEGGSAIDLEDNGSGDIRYSVYSTAAYDQQGGCVVTDLEIEAPFCHSALVVDGSEELQCNISGIYWSLDNAGNEITSLASNDTFTLGDAISGYGTILATLADGLEVYPMGDDLPPEITSNKRYWIRDLSGSTFKLAASLGGAAIALSVDGSGTLAITPKPAELIQWKKSAGSAMNPRVSPGARGFTSYGTFLSSDGTRQAIGQIESVALSRTRHKGTLVVESLSVPNQSGFAVIIGETDGVIGSSRLRLDNWYADFNGTDTKITLASSVPLTKAGEYTKSFRCSVRTLGRILASHTVSNDSYLGYFFDATTMRYNSYNNPGDRWLEITLPAACNDGDLHHYVIRRMPGNVFTAWMDDVECVTALVPDNVNLNPLTGLPWGDLDENTGWIDLIGRRGVDPGLWFDGQVDFIRLWDRGITDAEKTAEFAGTSPSGAVGAYELVDASGNKIRDFGTGNVVGTLSSSDIPAVWTKEFTPLELETGTLLATPVDGSVEYDGASLYFTTAGIRRSITLGNDIRVASATVTNTVTETTIHTSAVAANELKAGKMYKVTLLGKTTTANAAQFFTLRFKMGGTTLISVPMAAKAVTDEHFRSIAFITIRTIGAGGTYAAHVEGAIGDQVITATPVTGSVDTTAAEDMVTTLQWDAANAGNVFTIMQAMLEVIG